MSVEYINGSDLLVNVGGGAVGHSSTCTITMQSETKKRAVKPVSTLSKSAGLWQQSGVTGLSITIKADGLAVYKEDAESEAGFTEISPKWGKGASVEVIVYSRGNKSTPIIKGNFIIDSMEITGPAQDDTTYSISLSNDGEPEIYPGKPTGEEVSQPIQGEIES